jgi:general secretion pathway protein C
MIRSIDHLHRLPQSPMVAAWAMRSAGALALVMLARLLLVSISAPQLPLDEATAATVDILDAPQPLARWHLFGMPEGDARIVATTLALTLRGIVGSNAPGLGSAVIAGQDQKDIAYHVGDTLPGGGVLESIHADHVVIRNQGQRESLALTDKRAGQATSDAAASPQPVGPVSSLPAPTFAATTAAMAASAAAPTSTAGDADAAPAAAALLAGQANVLPVVENGRVVGARITAPDVAALERTGLRRDDVILSVEGQPADGPGIKQALEDGLRTGGDVTLVVRRGGREQTVRIGQ